MNTLLTDNEPIASLLSISIRNADTIAEMDYFGKTKDFIINIQLCGTRPFYLYYRNGIGWFRFFNGYGLKWKDPKRHALLFGERNGYSKAFTIGKWRIGIVKP